MPINIKRPNSALLRGVQITEFKGHIINPDPIILQETDFLLEEFLSPTKLVCIFESFIFTICQNYIWTRQK
jgi:hypothetical protein